MSATKDSTPQTSAGARTGFWIIAWLGILAAAIAWFWYGFAQLEAQTEQGKARAAGTTMAGSAELFGGVPLLLAHGLGLVLLLVFGWKGYRVRGLAFAVIAVLVASGIGIVLAEVAWGGELFELGINNDTYVP